MNIKTNYKKYCLFILPFVFLFLQGIYTNNQYAAIILLSAICAAGMKLSSKVLFPAVIMVFGFIISSVLNRQGFAFIYELSKIAVLLIFASCDNEKTLKKGIFYACSISSIIGIIAYIFNISAFDLIDIIDGQKNIQGTFGYANTMAVSSGIGAILSYYYIKKDNGSHFWYDLFLISNIICLYLTRSRFAIVAFGVAILVAVFLKYRKSRIYIISLLSVIFLGTICLFITGKESLLLQPTVVLRLTYWKDAIKLLKGSPFGIGIHRWLELQASIQEVDYSVKFVHNSILQLMLDGGIICGVGFLIFYMRTFVEKLKKNDILGVSLLVFIALHAFFDIDFCYGAVWLVLGVVASDVDKNINIKKWFLILAIAMLSVTIIAFPEKSAARDYPMECTELLNEERYDELSKLCDEWIEKAPHRQLAYDMKYVALKWLGDEKGLEDLKELEDKMNIVWQGETE